MSLDRRFWRLYGSSATSNLADGIGRTALPLLAASFTRNPVLVSGLVSFAFLPWLLFALPSGALVDRMDRRHAMAAANVVRALSTAVLAALVSTHTAGIGVLYVVAFALGLAETVYDSASRAILPQVVANRNLDRANSLLTVEETLGQTFLGAPVGSALFALAVVSPLLINAGGFAIAAVLILTLRGSFRPRRSATQSSVRHDIKDGIRWLAAHGFLRSLTLVSAGTALAETLANGVFVLYVLDVLHLPAGDFGLVLLVAGFGGLLGGLTTPLLVRLFGRAAMLVVGAVLGAAGILAMSFTSNGYLGAALFGISAFGVMIWNVITMSLRQALIPHELFGRVQGAYRTLVWGAIPIGAVLGGGLAKLFDIPTVFAISGVALLLLAGALAVIVRRYPDELADQPVDAALSDRGAAEGVYGVG
jgi:MFS family permease